MALALKSWTPCTIKKIKLKDKESFNQLSLNKWVYKVDNQALRAKTIWKCTLPKIKFLINKKLVYLYSFTCAKIILEYMLK